jgi:hypothetical protein
MAKKEAKAAKPSKVKKAAVKDTPTTPATSSAGMTTEPAPAPKIDLDRPVVKKAIDEGLAVLKDQKSKADAAWVIYGQLKEESKDLIVAAFVKGATLTEKGALTYWYNCRKRAAREGKTTAK